MLLGVSLDQDLTKFLKNRKSTFSWKDEDMIGISKDIITHKLNVDPLFRPIHQKRSKFAPDRNLIIQEEVERLLKAKMTKKVKFVRWLANVAVAQNTNGKCSVCVDLIDLNKAFPKDQFPLPYTHSLVDSTVGHEILTFMDASAGFQQIQMERSDEEYTTFITLTCIYCYM